MESSSSSKISKKKKKHNNVENDELSDQIIPKQLKSTQFNTTRILILKELYKTLPVISITVNTFLNHVLKGGVEITGQTPAGSYQLNMDNDIVRVYVETELYPVIEMILREMIIYGFCAIKIAESMTMPGWPIPVVIPHKDYTPTIMFNNDFQRIYVATALGRSFFTGDSYGEIPMSKLLVLHHPDDNGNLMSPLALCSDMLYLQQTLLECHLRSSVRNSRPLVVFGQKDTITDSLTRGGPESGRTSASLLSGARIASVGLRRAQVEATSADSIERQRAMNMASREMLEREKEFNHLKEKWDNTLHPGEYITRKESESMAPTFIRSIESEYPIAHSFIAPSGQHLERPIQHDSPKEFTAIVDRINADVYRAVGLPPALMKEVSDNAASVELTYTQLTESIQQFQERCKPILRQLLSLLFGANLNETVHDDIGTGNIIGSIASSSSPEVSKEVRNNLTHMLKPELADRILDTSLSYKERVNGLKLISELSRVELDFVFKPNMTFNTIWSYYERGVISEDALQELALNASGIPERMKRANPKQWIERTYGFNKKEEAPIPVSSAQPVAKTSPSSNNNNKRERTEPIKDKTNSLSNKKKRSQKEIK